MRSHAVLSRDVIHWPWAQSAIMALTLPCVGATQTRRSRVWTIGSTAHHAEGCPRSDERPERLRPRTVQPVVAIAGNHLDAGSRSLDGDNSGLDGPTSRESVPTKHSLRRSYPSWPADEYQPSQAVYTDTLHRLIRPALLQFS